MGPNNDDLALHDASRTTHLSSGAFSHGQDPKRTCGRQIQRLVERRAPTAATPDHAEEPYSGTAVRILSSLLPQRQDGRCYSRFSAALEAEVAPRATFGECGTAHEPPSKGVAVQLIQGTHVGCQFRRSLGLEESPDGAFNVIDAKVEPLPISLNVLVHEIPPLTALLRQLSPETQ